MRSHEKDEPWELTEPPRLRENDVEKACLDLLWHKGYWKERVLVGLYRSADLKRWVTGAETGTPDYVFMRGHRGFLLETKRPRGKLSKLQQLKIASLKESYGLPILVADSVESLADQLGEYECIYGRWDPSGRKPKL